MKVIAISGVSGCGKTSTIKHIAKKLDCPFLLFDDFVTPDTYPKDMKSWFQNGKDINDINTPEFVEALTLQKRQAAEKRAPFIFVEEPFGRQRAVMRSLIDYVIVLDIPMEICLSRIIQRRIAHDPNVPINALTGYLAKYNNYFRDIYFQLNELTKDDCDLIINDIMPIDAITDMIINWLGSQD